MERTTVYLDVPLKRRLKEEALRRGTTEAFLLREAVAAYLGSPKRPAVRAVGRSKDGGVARDADKALASLGFGRK
jgi:predicted DNA-binding protein